MRKQWSIWLFFFSNQIEFSCKIQWLKWFLIFSMQKEKKYIYVYTCGEEEVGECHVRKWLQSDEASVWRHKAAKLWWQTNAGEALSLSLLACKASPLFCFCFTAGAARSLCDSSRGPQSHLSKSPLGWDPWIIIIFLKAAYFFFSPYVPFFQLLKVKAENGKWQQQKKEN